MNIQSNDFIPAAQVAILDGELQRAVSHGTGVAYQKRKVAMFVEGKTHGEALRMQAAAAKRYALHHLPDLLEIAEQNMTANGISVLWAVDADEANRHVMDIIQRHEIRTVAKSKSMATEEIGLNHVIEQAGLEVIETDLGEFIAQLAGEPPSHIVAPIMHKTKEGIQKTLVEKAQMPPTDDVEEMTHFARSFLRSKFLETDLGVTGGNFIIAETGSIGIVTNEGNARMVTTLPRVHVAVVGIEKMVATLEDYALLTQVLPRSSTGQLMPVYTHMVNGPRRSDEPDGAEHVYVILLDNGRSNIYGTSYAEALACLRCGACLNGCPVYKVSGGHAYGWVYSGPIGAVLTPLYQGLDQAKPLPHASSLCGTCKEVCPVDIDLPRMLLDLRHDQVVQNLDEKKWNWGIKMWARVNRSPRLFKLAGKSARAATSLLPTQKLPGPLSGWTRYRSFPTFAKKSFRQRWQDRKPRET